MCIFKKLTILVLFSITILFCGNTVFAGADMPPVNFKGKNFYYHFVKDFPMPDNTNYYLSEGFEQKKVKDKLILNLDQMGYPILQAFEKAKEEYSSQPQYVLGTTKKDDDKFAVSFLEKTYEGKVTYNLLKSETNSLAGLNNTQIVIHLPGNSPDLAYLDLKYFPAFYKTKFPQVVDENGNILPRKYTLRFDNSPFILKYSVGMDDVGINVYLVENEKYEDYTKLLRVKYSPRSKMTPAREAETIKTIEKGYSGFWFIAQEKIPNGVILSLVTNLTDLRGGGKKVYYKELRIFKILPYKKGFKSLEYYTLFPDNQQSEQKIRTAEKRLREYIKKCKMPDLIPVNYGFMPIDQGYH